MSYPMCWGRFPLRGGCETGGNPLGDPFLPWTTLTPGEAGAITAESLAATVQATTGLPMTAAGIVQRATVARIYDESVDPLTTSITREKVYGALISGMVSGLGAGEAVRDLQRAVRSVGGTDNLIAIIRASADLGINDALLQAGEELGTAIFGSVDNVLAKLSDIFGGSETLNGVLARIGSTVGEMISVVREAMPTVTAVVNFALAVGQWVESLLPARTGRTAYVGEWATNSGLLYQRLCQLNGVGVPVSGWTYQWNPFLQEPTFLQFNVGVFTPFRALDCINYGLPDWREMFSSPAARTYIIEGPTGVPGNDAQTIVGCDSSKGKCAPWRWSQDRPQFRAAVVAASYINGGLGCIRGMGTWDSGRARFYAGADEDDEFFYNDVDPHYYTGYGNWWAKLGPEGSVLVAQPSVGGFADRRAWSLALSTATWVPLTSLIPGRDIPRKSLSPFRTATGPRTGKARPAAASEGIGAVPIVAGAAGVGLLAWLLLAK